MTRRKEDETPEVEQEPTPEPTPEPEAPGPDHQGPNPTTQAENPSQHTDVDQLDKLRREVSDPDSPPDEAHRKELIDDIEKLEAPQQRKAPR